MALIFEVGHGDEKKIPLRLIPFVVGSTWLPTYSAAVRDVKVLPFKLVQRSLIGLADIYP